MIRRYSITLLLYTVAILPICIVIGPFFSDLSISLSSLIFLIVLHKNEYKIYFLNRYSIFFFIWYFYLLLLSLFSDNVLLSLESTLFYFRFWFYSLALCYLLINIKRAKNLVFYFFLLSFCFVVIDAFIQLIFGINLVGYEYNFQPKQTRLSGIFGNEQVLGSYLARLSPLIFAIFLMTDLKKYFKSHYYLIFISIIFILILFSGERSSLFLYILFLIFLLFDLRLISINKIFKIVGILSISLVLFTLILSNNIRNRLFDYTLYQFSEGEKINVFSIQHQVVYETSLKIFNEYKLFGIAPKLFREKCQDFPTLNKLDSTINGCQTHPHNTLLQMLVETGLVGTAFFLFIIVFFIKEVLNIYNYSNDKYELFSFKYVIVAILISLFPFIPSGNFFNNWLNSIYYFPLGIFLYYRLFKFNS